MEKARWESIEKLFHAAIELPKDERVPFLEDTCSDQGLRREVLNLLVSADRAEPYFEGNQRARLLGEIADEFSSSDKSEKTPQTKTLSLPQPDFQDLEETLGRTDQILRVLIDSALTPNRESEYEDDTMPDGGRTFRYSAPVSDHIGPYRIIRKIDEGGMGSVYEAVQEKPVFRKVAIKILKEGLPSRGAIKRFQSEYRTLAIMNHVNIAQIYDAGVTEEKSPYFSMEFIPGVSITAFADGKRLTIQQRLDLFIMVCEGIHHAHQKGIIHRDIKPSNILVIEREGSFLPKIIDFGIAKTLNPHDSGPHPKTMVGLVLGTPHYMSPEQARSDVPDIDIRADIYALGAVLYELLSGFLPFEGIIPENAYVQEVLGVIIDSDPVPLRNRFSEQNSDNEMRAKKRRSSVKQMHRLLLQDLNWITLKALEKDRENRYSTARALAEDIRAFLENRPVQARHPSISYQVKKFARRHRWPLAAISTIMLLLITFTALLSVQLVRLRQSNIEIENTRNQLASVAGFLEGVLGSSSPDELGPEAKLIDIIRLQEPVLDHQFKAQPLTEARIRHVISNTYVNLGELKAARKHLEETLRLRQKQLGPNDRTTLLTASSMGLIELEEERYERAEDRLKTTALRQKEFFGSADEGYLNTQDRLATLFTTIGQFQEAKSIYDEILPIQIDHFGENNRRTFRLKSNLANLYLQSDQTERAHQLQNETLQAQQQYLGEDHPDTMTTMSNLAVSKIRIGKPKEASALLERVIQLRSAKLGADHPSLKRSLAFQGWALLASRQYQQAIDVLEPLLPFFLDNWGEKSQRTMDVRSNLGLAYSGLNRFDDAIAIYTEMFDIIQGEDSFTAINKITWVNNYALCLLNVGKMDLAISSLSSVLEELGESLPASSIVLSAHHTLGELYLHRNDFLNAHKQFQKSRDQIQKIDFPKDQSAFLEGQYGYTLAQTGKPNEGMTILKASHQTLTDIGSPLAMDLARNLDNLINELKKR